MAIHPDNKRVYVTLNKKLLASLYEEAEKNKRTISKEVEYLIKTYVKK